MLLVASAFLVVMPESVTAACEGRLDLAGHCVLIDPVDCAQDYLEAGYLAPCTSDVNCPAGVTPMDAYCITMNCDRSPSIGGVGIFNGAVNQACVEYGCENIPVAGFALWVGPSAVYCFKAVPSSAPCPGEPVASYDFGTTATPCYSQIGDGLNEQLGQVNELTPDIPVNPPAVDRTVPVPGIVAPGTCSSDVCEDGTTIPGVGTPPLPGITAPGIPYTCIPFVVCVGPSDPTPITGPVPGIPVTPPVPVSSACELVPMACVGPIPLTPPASVQVEIQFTGMVPTDVGVTSIGPTTIVVGGVPVTLCPSTCPFPLTAAPGMEGQVTVTVTVGSQVVTHTVPFEA